MAYDPSPDVWMVCQYKKLCLLLYTKSFDFLFTLDQNLLTTHIFKYSVIYERCQTFTCAFIMKGNLFYNTVSMFMLPFSELIFI